MKRLISGVFLCLLINSVLAQNSPVKFGVIPLEDLKMTIYDKDSSASAVILADYGEAYVVVNTNFASLMFERHVRIKILKNEGLKWADASIPLYHVGSTEERVSRLKASTFNLENGKLVESPMAKDGVFKEKFNRNINLQKFTLPNVKEGSVIEYSYTVSSEFLTNFPDWQFQYDIPVRWSEYWALFPEFFTFEKYMQGYISPTSYEVKNKSRTDFNTIGHHWISKNVPAFKAEPFMTSEDDYVSKINLALSYITFPGQPVQQIMGTWVKLNTTLLESESFGKAITGSNFLKKKVEELTAGMTDPIQKVKAIFNFVQKTIEWDGEKDKYVDNLKKVFEDRKGTTADINLMLASMLEKINIPVDMVLLSTRDHGFIRQQYPMEDQFNYVICLVTIGDKKLLLDATDKYMPMGILPERCLNGLGLIISKVRHGWLEIDAMAKARTVIQTELAINGKGELKGKVNYTCDGYDAHRLRNNYSRKGEGDYVKDFLSDKNWEVAKSEFQNMEEIEQSAKQLHEFSVNEYGMLAGDVLYINPFVAGQTKENIFKQSTREYPVDFGSAIEKIYMSRIAIPDGFSVDELPPTKIITLPNGAAKYTYSVTHIGNSLNVISSLQINKSLFLQDEYPNLREFYNQLVAKQAEQIVLKKN